MRNETALHKSTSRIRTGSGSDWVAVAGLNLRITHVRKTGAKRSVECGDKDPVATASGSDTPRLSVVSEWQDTFFAKLNET
jgi:hypothetical protein